MTTKFYKTPSDIISWLNSMNIKYYHLVLDKEYSYVVNVERNVDISNKNLNSIPVKFYSVNGTFNCSNNNLVSLAGSPDRVRGDYNCSHNKLTDLINSPLYLDGVFNAAENFLTSIRGITPHIRSALVLSGNKINTFKFIPLSIGSSIYLEKNSHPLIQNIQENEIINYLQLKELQKIELIKEEKNMLEQNIEICNIKPSFNEVHKI